VIDALGGVNNMPDKQISVEFLNKILNYLASKPFIEVQQLIAEIYKLEDIKKDKAEEAKK